MKNKCLIDTSIFIVAYTNVESSDKKEIARNLLSKLYSANIANISIQNLIEYINVAKHKLKISNEDILKKDVINIEHMFNIIYYSPNTMIEALELSFEYKIPFFDALLAQTMLENGINIIYSENEKNFKKIPGIKVINPFKKPFKKSSKKNDT